MFFLFVAFSRIPVTFYYLFSRNISNVDLLFVTSLFLYTVKFIVYTHTYYPRCFLNIKL